MGTLLHILLVVCALGLEALGKEPRYQTSGMIQEMHTPYGTFRAEREVQYPSNVKDAPPTVTEWIVTPYGKKIRGSPDGLWCGNSAMSLPGACDFRSFALIGSTVYLLTKHRVYWYEVGTDTFSLQDRWLYELVEPLDRTRNLFLMRGQTRGGSLYMLVPRNEAWFPIELPIQADFSRSYTVDQRDDRITFKFHPGRMVCDLSHMSCVVTRRLTPK